MYWAVPEEWTFSGITHSGTAPYLRMRLAAMSHWPPSGRGLSSSIQVSRSSGCCAAKWRMLS